METIMPNDKAPKTETRTEAFEVHELQVSSENAIREELKKVGLTVLRTVSEGIRVRKENVLIYQEQIDEILKLRTQLFIAYDNADENALIHVKSEIQKLVDRGCRRVNDPFPK